MSEIKSNCLWWIPVERSLHPWRHRRTYPRHDQTRFFSLYLSFASDGDSSRQVIRLVLRIFSGISSPKLKIDWYLAVSSSGFCLVKKRWRSEPDKRKMEWNPGVTVLSYGWTNVDSWPCLCLPGVACLKGRVRVIIDRCITGPNSGQKKLYLEE